MTDYKAWQSHVHITNQEMTDELAKHFPKYSKVCGSYVNAPEKYGVCLLPEAERILLATFGPGPGFASLPWKEQKKKRSDRRRKSNSVTVRMDDELYQFAQAAKAESGCDSMQALFEHLLIDYIRANAIIRDDPAVQNYLKGRL